MLELKNIDAYYGLVQALWDISIKVEKQTIVSIVGANGAGKTTIMRIISGIIKSKKGQVFFDGEDITNKESHKIVNRGIAHVPEGRQIFPHMSVYENLEMGAIFRDEAKSVMADTIDYVYTLFPRLKERTKQLAGTMSGGERQMLAIGRALMAKPKLLLIDEPSLGLAPSLVIDVFKAVKEVLKQGVTVLLVEQNVQKSLKLASRGYVLDNGRITLSGTGKELLENPHMKAAYLGH